MMCGRLGNGGYAVGRSGVRTYSTIGDTGHRCPLSAVCECSSTCTGYSSVAARHAARSRRVNTQTREESGRCESRRLDTLQ